MSTSKITVDLKQRTFSIEVPDERVEAVLQRIEVLFKNEGPTDVYDDHAEIIISPPQPNVEKASASQNDEAAAGPAGNGRKRRGKGGSKVKTIDPVDLPLSTDQRQKLRDFFEEKSPKQQNDMVAVLAVKLKEILDQSTFNIGEILSALRIVNKPIPKNLPAVLGNMKTAGIAVVKDGDLVVTYLMEDHVNHHMNKKAKE